MRLDANTPLTSAQISLLSLQSEALRCSSVSGAGSLAGHTEYGSVINPRRATGVLGCGGGFSVQAMASVDEFQILGGRFAVLPRLYFKFDTLAFIKAIDPGLFDSRNVYEGILAASLGLDEAVALVYVEPFYRTDRHVHSLPANGGMP